MVEKVHNAMDQQCRSRGFVAPVDVFMDIGVLDKKKFEDWRRGRIPYLEAVCSGSLHKLTEIMKVVRKYASQKGLKPSVTDYRQWGAKSRVLRFSKYGNPNVEKSYATHYVDVNKKQKAKHDSVLQEQPVPESPAAD